jgi:hypothetical protein
MAAECRARKKSDFYSSRNIFRRGGSRRVPYHRAQAALNRVIDGAMQLVS